MLLLVAVLVLALWVLFRMQRRDGQTEPEQQATPVSANAAYHAVSIRIAGQACRAARDLTGRRFLSTAAPKLPLPDCDAQDCSCRFIHHKDRRAGKDRRSPFSPAGFGGGTGRFESEQRKGRDRRKNDGEDYL